MSETPWKLRCVQCDRAYAGLELRYRCDCSGTLNVEHDFADSPTLNTRLFDDRLRSKAALDRSGVWRFRELVLPLEPEHVISRFEGNTNLYQSSQLASYVGLDDLYVKHEGENPTGSFKDRGMTTGISAAKKLGMTRVAVASTGNTSASAASYAAAAGMECFVFIPDGKIAFGKLSQALAFGAKTVQIEGDFDDAMALVQSLCAVEGIYLLNSVNPFRIEGQKAIGIEILQDLDWQVPDWIVLPGGNLGNNTALTKGMRELFELGLISKVPRVAVIQAAGANPLYQAWHGDGELRSVRAQTIATAIQIGDPVSFTKSLSGLRAVSGHVEEVSDVEILDAKAKVDASGIGAEPASCATIAGMKKMVAQGLISSTDHVVGILTGHVLKDPGVVVDYHMGNGEAGSRASYANRPIKCDADLDEIRRRLFS